MPFKPESYRLADHPHLLGILETAIRRSDEGHGAIFVPCVCEKEAQSLKFKLQRYRKAYEIQHVNSELVSSSKFSYLKFVAEEVNGEWGVSVTETPASKLRILDKDTGTEVNDQQAEGSFDI